MCFIRTLRGVTRNHCNGPNGDQRFVNIRFRPLRDQAGEQIVGAIGVICDVTKLHRLDQIKEEFISTASHELQAPLTSLLLISRIIERRAAKSEQSADFAPLAQDVVRFTKRMSRLVTDMLYLTRINSNRLSIYLEACDLVKIVSNTIEEQRLYWQRGITLTTAEHSLIAVVDSERIWQVVTNLISNAAKFSNSAMPVEVFIERVENPAPLPSHQRP